MPRRLRLVLALLLALPLLAMPTPVLAEVTVTITPVSAPDGTDRTIGIGGLADGQPAIVRVYPLKFWRPHHGDRSVYLGFHLGDTPVVGDSVGSTVVDLGFTGLTVEKYVVVVMDQSSNPLAEAVFEVTSLPNRPSLTIAQENPQLGTPVVVSGKGYTPGSQQSFRLGLAGSLAVGVLNFTVEASGNFEISIPTTNLPPGYTYEMLTFAGTGAGAAPSADKAYFTLPGTPGALPAGPHAFTEQYLVARGDGLEFNLAGFAQSEALRYYVVEDRAYTAPDQRVPLGGLTWTHTYQPNTADKLNLPTGSYPPGDYLLVIDSPPPASADPALAALSHTVVLASFTVVGKPTLTPRPPDPNALCFPGFTPYCVSGRFRAQWEQHGGLAINGYPLSPERIETLEDGQPYLVQWFERVRMEHHPANQPPYDVLLGQFGRILHPADPPVGPKPGMQFFDVTGHNVPPDFLAFWLANGGLPQFGYPLSEVITETLEDGKQYEVQYFERARFERHTANQPPYNVLLGQFGRTICGTGCR